MIWETEQFSRRKQAQKVCARYHPGDSIKISHNMPEPSMVVDHKHRVLYCSVPKAACTSWKNMICQLINKENKTNEQLLNDRLSDSWAGGEIHHMLKECGMHLFKSLTDKDRDMVISSYTKILAVRHPFERIKSVYTNKLYVDPKKPRMGCQGCESWGRDIMKRNQKTKRRTMEQLEAGRGVTFEEFIEYAVDRDEPHWTEQKRLCKPCHIKYDYIMKVETMTEDARQVIRRVFNSTLPFIAANHAKYKHVSENYTIPKQVRRKFRRRYKIDADMFGYTL